MKGDIYRAKFNPFYYSSMSGRERRDVHWADVFPGLLDVFNGRGSGELLPAAL